MNLYRINVLSIRQLQTLFFRTFTEAGEAMVCNCCDEACDRACCACCSGTCTLCSKYMCCCWCDAKFASKGSCLELCAPISCLLCGYQANRVCSDQPKSTNLVTRLKSGSQDFWIQTPYVFGYDSRSEVLHGEASSQGQDTRSYMSQSCFECSMKRS